MHVDPDYTKSYLHHLLPLFHFSRTPFHPRCATSTASVTAVSWLFSIAFLSICPSFQARNNHIATAATKYINPDQSWGNRYCWLLSGCLKYSPIGSENVVGSTMLIQMRLKADGRSLIPTYKTKVMVSVFASLSPRAG